MSWAPGSARLVFTQTTVAGLVLVPTVIAVFGSSGTYDGGIQAMFWLFYACVASLYSIAFSLMIGLPVRLNARRLAWWRRRWWIAALGIVAGGVGMAGSFHPALIVIRPVEIGGMTFDEVVPAWWLLLPAWFVLAYCLTNFWFPALRPLRLEPIEI